MHVVADSSLDLLLAFVHRLTHGLAVDEEDEGEQKKDDDHRRQAVAPDIDALVVNHEQTSEYFFGGIKIDSVPVSYVQVILHVGRGCLVVPDVVMLLSHVFYLFIRFLHSLTGLPCLL